MNSTLLQRVVLRHFLRLQLTRPTRNWIEEARLGLQAALRNRAAEAMILDACEELHGGPLMEAVVEFFEWLLAHADEIIAIVLKLIPLFTDHDA